MCLWHKYNLHSYLQQTIPEPCMGTVTTVELIHLEDCLERPMSATLMMRSSVSTTLKGFRSLCTIFNLCM